MRAIQNPGPNNQSALQTSLARKRQSLTTFETHEKRKRRKPGTVALKQIKFYQQTTCTLVRLAPFARLVKEIGDFYSEMPLKWQPLAIEALQCATEYFMTALFEDVGKAATHAKRVTIRPEDLHLVRGLRGKVNPSEIF